MRITNTLLAMVVVASVASASGLKSTVQPVYNQVGKAFMKKDVKAFEKITRSHVADDFKCTQNGQDETYDQMLAGMKQTLGMFRKVNSASAKITSAKETKDGGTTMTTHMMSGTMVGPDKKLHKLVLSGKTVDTWKRDGKGWKMVSMKWTKQSATMDGKPFNPGK